MPTVSPSLGQNGGHQGSVALAWALQHLVSLGPGPASCLGLGGAGGSPIRAPSQNLPLSLVTAASLCLAWVQPPHTSPLRAAAPPSKSSGLGGIGQGLTLSRPQFLHLEMWRLRPLVPLGPAPPGLWDHQGVCCSCLHFLHSTPHRGAAPECCLGLFLAVHPWGGCCLSEPQFLIHKIG